MFSPLCFIIALAYAFKKADPGGGSNILGWLIDTLTYADDAALIDSTAEQATVRITAIATALRKLADQHESPKTQTHDLAILKIATWVRGSEPEKSVR